MFNYIIFILVIFYILYTSTIYEINKDYNWLHDTVLYGSGLFIIIMTFLNLYKNKSDLNYWLLFIIIGIVGTVIANMMYSKAISDDKKETYMNNYKIKTLLSIFLFIIVGIVSYFIANLFGDECTNANPELLCSKSFISVFILMAILVYYAVNFWKKYIQWGFVIDNNSTFDWYNILLIGLWQFYLYMVIDGFSGGSVVKTSNSYYYGGGSSNIFEMVTIMTIIFIICNFIMQFITNQECDKWKNVTRVNNIKEIQANIIITTIISVIMVMTISRN